MLAIRPRGKKVGQVGVIAGMTKYEFSLVLEFGYSSRSESSPTSVGPIFLPSRPMSNHDDGLIVEYAAAAGQIATNIALIFPLISA